MSRPSRKLYVDDAAYEAAMVVWAKTEEGLAAAAEIERRRSADAREIAVEATRAEDEAVAEMGVPLKDVRLIRAGGLALTGAVRALVPRPETAKDVLVVLSGNNGCGKTTAASSWLLAGKGGSLFVKAAALARWDCYDTEQMDRLLLAPRLVIDDLGVEYMDAKGRFLSVLTEVIDVRYDRSLPTVITTGLGAADFKLRYRERIIDRMREVGRFMELDGPSMRGQR